MVFSLQCVTDPGRYFERPFSRRGSTPSRCKRGKSLFGARVEVGISSHLIHLKEVSLIDDTVLEPRLRLANLRHHLHPCKQHINSSYPSIGGVVFLSCITSFHCGKVMAILAYLATEAGTRLSRPTSCNLATKVTKCESKAVGSAVPRIHVVFDSLNFSSTSVMNS